MFCSVQGFIYDDVLSMSITRDYLTLLIEEFYYCSHMDTAAMLFLILLLSLVTAARYYWSVPTGRFRLIGSYCSDSAAIYTYIKKKVIILFLLVDI